MINKSIAVGFFWTTRVNETQLKTVKGNCVCQHEQLDWIAIKWAMDSVKIYVNIEECAKQVCVF